MTRKEHLLTILAEECAETAKRTSKALRFSLAEVQPGQSFTNAERIVGEFNDIVAVMEMLKAEGHLKEVFDYQHIQAKKAQVEHFMSRSKANGTLTE